jgi:hypothetical protein
MKTGRYHIDLEDDYDQIEECERNKSNHNKLPPILVTIRTFYATEVVRENKWTKAVLTLTTEQTLLLNQLHTD